MKHNLTHSIVYTFVDEAPALATHSLLPIFKSICSKFDIPIHVVDISLAARVIAMFSDLFPQDLKMLPYLDQLGDLTQYDYANIIKLPNISASIPQLKAVIKELQEKGYPLPDYPNKTISKNDIQTMDRYKKILGSAVNPVLREGNSDRRVLKPVKLFAKINPHPMGKWCSDSKTHIASMKDGDFFDNERSLTLQNNDFLSIVFIDRMGNEKVMKTGIEVKSGDVIDATFMKIKALRLFFEEQINDAKNKNILLSIHLKATMMKVSDPIIFGEMVKAYYKPFFDSFNDLFSSLDIDIKNGFQSILTQLNVLDDAQKKDVFLFLQSLYKKRPQLAMVDSDKGISNLYVPSDVIIDASMPAMIRDGGKMWGPDGQLHDTKAIIPDRSYADVYRVVIDDCKKNGSFDPKTMGSVANVGLMAKKAEEYGSHDKTFHIPSDGKMCVFNSNKDTLIEQFVEEGDIWRMCHTADSAIQDWINLAIKRAKLTQHPIVFWLNKDRAHDAELIHKVNQSLAKLDLKGCDIYTLPPSKATQFSVDRIRSGLDTIAVTGNVLRDYLTDLFPILELGTSAKMLSVVPLLKGGALFETGAGGSAPKHVQQFLKEGHLRWDSLGEFLAMSESLSHYSLLHNHKGAALLAKTLSEAVEKWLLEKRAPSRKVYECDTRASHFYLLLYWVERLSQESEIIDFSMFYRDLKNNEAFIVNDFLQAQGKSINIGGYYYPDPHLVKQAMCCSSRLNSLIKKYH